MKKDAPLEVLLERTDWISGKESSSTAAEEELNKKLQNAAEPDQSSHETTVTSDNHAADTNVDRAGRSHVDCLDHVGGMELDEKECWRPSYMFNLLRAAGWDAKDAYRAFENYQGKRSYEQLNLQLPTRMSQEDGYTDEWPHVRDPDEMGLAPNNMEDQESRGDNELQRGSPVWHSQGQRYRVQGWSAPNTCSRCYRRGTFLASIGGDEAIGCMIPMNRKTERPATPDGSDDEDDTMEMVCDMAGRSWEDLPFPIIIDSVACASVMPTSWRSHVPLHETPQSKAGGYYRAANGNKIYHEGERIVSMMTQEGTMRDMRFTVPDEGSRVRVTNVPHGTQGSVQSFMERRRVIHRTGGYRRTIVATGGRRIVVLRANVAPVHRQTGGMTSQDYAW